HGLDGGQILGDDAVQAAGALFDVPADAAEDPLVGVGVHKDLVVEQLQQRRLGKGEHALDDQDGCRLDVAHFLRPVVDGVVVDRAVHRTAGLQLLQLPDQQVVVKGVGVVVVQQAALFVGQLV